MKIKYLIIKTRMNRKKHIKKIINNINKEKNNNKQSILKEKDILKI